MPTLEQITIAPQPHLRRARRGRARRAAGAAAARLCGIDALLARAGRGARRHGLSRHRAEPARLFAGRAAGSAEFSNYHDRPPDGRRDGDRRGLRAMATRAFISSAMTGAAASPGGSPTATRAAGLAHHPVAAAPERLQPRAADGRRRAGAPLAAPQGVSRARCRRNRTRRRRQMAARSAGRQRRSAERDRAASRRARQQGRDGRRRSPGIARAARSAARSARSGCRRSTSGAMPTTPSAASRPKAPVDFIAAPYRFEVLPGVGHFAADQAPERVSELLLAHIAAHPA